MISRELDGSTLILRLEHPGANALDVELLQALLDALRDAAVSEASALVITGRGSAFSAGLDLFRIVAGGAAYLERLLPLLNEVFLALFRFPRPVVAAVNGHAIAGGCVLVCCCDHRVIAEGGARIGVPELYVGVPFPTAALEILRHAVGGHRVASLVCGGQTWAAADALRCGLVDEIAPADTVVARALERARRLASLSPAVFATAKRQLRQPALARIEQQAPLDDADIVSMWQTPETLAAIERYVEHVLRNKTGR